MNKKLKFKIATPERVVYESEADSVTCPTQMGEVTILPNHIPLVANLAPGELRLAQDGETRAFAVSGGFLEVRPLGEVVVLADAAEHEEEIDLERAQEARARAQKLMARQQDAEQFAETQGALERSLVRIKIASKRKKYRDVGGHV